MTPRAGSIDYHDFEAMLQVPASSPVPTCAWKRTDLSRDMIAEPQIPSDQGNSAAAESLHSTETQNTSDTNKKHKSSSKQAHDWTTINAIFANMGGSRF